MAYTLKMYVSLVAVGVAVLCLSGCNAQAPQAATSSISDSDCETAFAAASAESDADALQIALEDAIGACETADDWARASQEHARELQGVDAQQFLLDRCLNGPPDITDSTLCQTVSVDR